MKPNQSQYDEVEEAARRLISLAEAAEICGLSAGHLRLLVRRGVIWGRKLGRNWVTTEEAVKRLPSTRHPPRAEAQAPFLADLIGLI